MPYPIIRGYNFPYRTLLFKILTWLHIPQLVLLLPYQQEVARFPRLHRLHLLSKSHHPLWIRLTYNKISYSLWYRCVKQISENDEYEKTIYCILTFSRILERSRSIIPYLSKLFPRSACQHWWNPFHSQFFPIALFWKHSINN